jgi:hypothetical protein
MRRPDQGIGVDFLIAVACAALIGMTPGESYSVLNASSGSIWLQCGTVDRPNEKPWLLPRGHGDGGSGDHSELVFLRVRYPSGRTITLDADGIRRIKASSSFRRGAWWVDDSGVTYIRERDANIRWGPFSDEI